MTKRTETSILASAMYALARDIDSADGIANAAIFEAAERLELQQHEIEKLTAALGNLLAVIHHDGGQYLAAHGVEKACADAEAKVARWIMLETSIDAMIEQASRAEREACAIIAISPICGSQGFAGPSCCILAPGHKGGHKYGIPRDRTAGEIAYAIRARSEHLPERSEQ